jgi:hypothetical protein
MSNVRCKLLAGASPEDLEKQVNDFLSRPGVELKQFDYETDGYEKPYSASILYHETEPEPVQAEQASFWRKRIFGGRG